MPRRASRKELTEALLAHYGSPGRLANYRREFDKTVWKPGEDPSNFAIALETLAVKAFGDMGQAARLRLIRDRFIAGHGSCELRRYLDCVPPDTPLRDIVNRCRVWESHADPEIRWVSKPMPELAYPAYVVNEPEYETECSSYYWKPRNANRPLKFRPNQQDWKQCFERILQNSSRHDNSPSFDRHDAAGRK